MPTQTELRKELTDQILSALDNGVVPWKQPWSLDPNCGRPLNGDTKRPYNGINVLLLALHNHRFRFDSGTLSLRCGQLYPSSRTATRFALPIVQSYGQ